jgi:hypothetical protein
LVSFVRATQGQCLIAGFTARAFFFSCRLGIALAVSFVYLFERIQCPEFYKGIFQF